MFNAVVICHVNHLVINLKEQHVHIDVAHYHVNVRTVLYVLQRTIKHVLRKQNVNNVSV